MTDLVRPIGPALALRELESIARGMRTADAVVKRAQVRLVRGEPVSPGKYLLLFTGDVAEVEESFQAGVEAAGPGLIDRLFLPGVSDALAAALVRGPQPFVARTLDSVGIVETQTVASALLAADAALKRAEVRLSRIELARGIGGKGYFVVEGSLDMVIEALAGAAAAIEPSLLLTTELIEQPHPELRGPIL